MAEVEPTRTPAATPAAKQEAALRDSAVAAREAQVKNTADAKAKLGRDRDARQALNEEAAAVMENSRPTPTQEENDLARLNALNHDDKEDPENPDMPPLHEQQARIAEAGSGKVAYKTRDAKAGKA